jgi:hypothetical protein
MIKWVIAIYIACVAVFIVAIVVVTVKLGAEISNVGLKTVIDRVWCGRGGCKP